MRQVSSAIQPNQRQVRTKKHGQATQYTCIGTQLPQASTLTQPRNLHRHVRPALSHTRKHSHTKHFRLASQTWWWWCWIAIHTTCIPQAQCPFEFNSAILSITFTLSMLCYEASEHYFGTFCGNFSSRSTRTENAPATRCKHRLHNNKKKRKKTTKLIKTDF